MNRTRLAVVLCVVSSPALASPRLLLAQAAPGNDAAARELAIASLLQEREQLEDKASGIGFTFPILGIGLGVGMLALGASNGIDALSTAGIIVGGLSSLWLVWRIVKRAMVGVDIGKVEDQLDELKAQRLQPRTTEPLRPPSLGAALAQLSFTF